MQTLVRLQLTDVKWEFTLHKKSKRLTRVKTANCQTLTKLYQKIYFFH